MKCHYTYYVENGEKHKVLIPGCWDVVISNNIRDCTCEDALTPCQFEKERFNEVISRLQDEIKGLRDENEYLMTIIKRLKK
ncbi:MAG TPA: hypothetical protein DDW85_02440 [Porphyromonadaceae bacterium]|nr:hypothetical protein [Porphyromonadaceae bacterium]